MSSNPHYSRRYKPWLFPFKARKPRNLARYPGSRKHPLQHLASCPLPLTPRPLSFLPCLSVAGKAMTTENSRQFEGGHSQHSGLLLPFWHWFWVLSGLRVHPPLLFQNCQSSVATYLRTPFRIQLRIFRLCLTTISCNRTWFFLLCS